MCATNRTNSVLPSDCSIFLFALLILQRATTFAFNIFHCLSTSFIIIAHEKCLDYIGVNSILSILYLLLNLKTPSLWYNVVFYSYSKTNQKHLLIEKSGKLTLLAVETELALCMTRLGDAYYNSQNCSGDIHIQLLSLSVYAHECDDDLRINFHSINYPENKA